MTRSVVTPEEETARKVSEGSKVQDKFKYTGAIPKVFTKVIKGPKVNLDWRN